MTQGNSTIRTLVLLKNHHSSVPAYNVIIYRPQCTRDSTKFFFSHRVVGRWNSLNQEMVNAPSVKTNKGGLFIY